MDCCCQRQSTPALEDVLEEEEEIEMSNQRGPHRLTSARGNHSAGVHGCLCLLKEGHVFWTARDALLLPCYEQLWQKLDCGQRKNGYSFFFFFCVPQLHLWGSPLLGEIFAYVTVF